MVRNADKGVTAEIVTQWADDFTTLWRRTGTCFFRHDLRTRAERYVRGLLGRVERKNGWQMAEYLGDATPHAMQRLFDRAVWCADTVQRLDTLGKEIPDENWSRLSVADGTKGPRVYDWAAGQFGIPTDGGLIRWVLFRRSVEKPQEQAYYLCLSSADTTAPELAQAAGQQWNIECCFEAAKQETGLDEYEVRSWQGWYRHITLSMLALAFLSVMRMKSSGKSWSKKRGRI